MPPFGKEVATKAHGVSHTKNATLRVQHTPKNSLKIKKKKQRKDERRCWKRSQAAPWLFLLTASLATSLPKEIKFKGTLLAG